MLKELWLENWKGFKGRHCIPLSKVTLLYGANSSGKSSVIQALLCSGIDSSGEPMNPNFLDFKQGWRDFGSFRENVNGQDSEKQITIGLGIDSTYSRASIMGWVLKKRFGYSPPTTMNRIFLSYEHEKKFKRWDAEFKELREGNLMTSVGYCSGGTLTPDFELKIGCCSMLAQILPSGYESITPLALLSHTLNNDKPERRFIDPYMDRDASFTDDKSLKNFIEIFRSIMPDTVTGATDNNNVVRKAIESARMFFRTHGDFGNMFELVSDKHRILSGQVQSIMQYLFDPVSMLNRVRYIGPLRRPPERFDIGECIPGSYEENGRDLGLVPEWKWSGIFDQVNEWFARLKVPYMLSVEETGNQYTGCIETLLLNDKRTGTVHTLADVGYGISQLLPILQMVRRPLPKFPEIIAVEQPELHLHPRLQANLADFFIETSDGGHTSENESEGRGSRQWVIETHSEAIMLRIQRRIREGKLDPKDVSVVYIGSTSDAGSVVEPLRLNDEGDFIDEWPGGFFEEDFDELFGVDQP